MRIREFSEQAGRVVTHTLKAMGECGDPEIERISVSGEVVIRDGNHYRIDGGVDEWVELEARACRLEGRCDCGAPLSVAAERFVCRICGREFRR